MKKIIAIFLSIILSSTFAEEKKDNLSILMDGKKIKELEKAAIKQMKSVKVEHFYWSLRTSRFYIGVPVPALLNATVPELLDKVVELEFISTNGYKSYISMENFKKVEGVLTYAPADSGKFEHYITTEKKVVDLGPYYLVWDFKTSGKEDKFQYGSVFQINKINLITNAVDFGLQDSKVDSPIQLGFRTYKKYCLSCHAVGQWGGDLSIDLLEKKIIEKKGAEYIVKYALNPESLNSQTQMLPLPKYKNRNAMAEAIVDFLKFAKTPGKYIENNKLDADKTRLNSLNSILSEIRDGSRKK